MDTILDKYMSHIHEIVADTGTHVFRGQSDACWRLRSGASRRLMGDGIGEDHPQYVDEYLEYHRDLVDRARRIAPYGQKGGMETGLQLLARLQHFGAATGLLDFTYSPLVALWFACEDPSRHGKVFFVSHAPPNTMFVTAEQEAQDIASIFSTAEDATGPTYLLWEPVADGDAALRIVGQRSVFVIGRPVIDDGRVKDVQIDMADKESLRRELEQLDVSERTMFRDLVGFCQQEGATARRAGPRTAAEYQRRANGAFVRGEYRDAVKMYGKCLELCETGETYFLRGNANAALGCHLEAVEDYGRALDSPDVSPDVVTPQRGSGQVLPFLFANFNRGNEEACLGRYAEAITDYERAAELVPQFGPTYFNCGNAHFMDKRYAEAVTWCDRALALDWQDANARVNKALALVLQGKLEVAERCYREAQVAGPLPDMTLESLLHLRAAFADLPESQIKVEVADRGNTLRATARHPEYRGTENHAGLFKGIRGSVGNVGGFGRAGGEGFGGGPGVVVVLERGPKEP